MYSNATSQNCQKTLFGTEENHRRPEKKRVVLDTSSNDEEQIKKSNTRKKANQKPQEIEFDLEEEQRPEIIDIATSSTDGVDHLMEGPAVKIEKEEEQESEEAPGNSAIGFKVTIRWEVERTGPSRVLENKRVPTKRYGIDMISKGVAE